MEVKYQNEELKNQNDLISRQAVLDCFHDWIDKHGDVHTADEMPEYRAIEELPSAQPEKAQLSGEGTTFDCISRQAAIDIIDNYMDKSIELHYLPTSDGIKKLISVLPSAQPESAKRIAETEQNVSIDDFISRKAAIEAFWQSGVEFRPSQIDEVMRILEQLPSAQPEYKLDEWCTDCKEYDKKRGSCPRFNKVIRTALQDSQLQPQWIPCSERLPKDRYYVLVTYQYEYGLIDHGITWYGDAEKKWNTSREVIAWMPLPECYKGEQ